MSMNWVGAVIIFLMSGMILLLPRRHVLFPLMVVCCFMTFGQELVIAQTHWNGLRIIVLFGWIRLVVRGEILRFRLNAVDWTLILWIIVSTIAYTVVRETTAAFINRLGVAFDNLGLYFFFRMTVRNLDEIEHAIGVIALIIAPLAAAMLLEASTGENPFAYLGGVRESTWIREGRLRCQGPFKHPILAGTFGAALIPLFMGYWLGGAKKKTRAVIGFLSGAAITLTSGSTGPLLTFATGVCGLCLWPLRNRMAAIRWGILGLIIALHVFMSDPVWYLPAKLGGALGGTGWHRSFLIDQAIHYFGEWWLVGTKQTQDFIAYTLAAYPDQVDITNQYINEGFKGGFLAMLLFMAGIVLCYIRVGRVVRLQENQPYRVQILFWSMGVALTAHVVSFMGVSYFDQNIVPWFLLLAMISVTDYELEEVENREG